MVQMNKRDILLSALLPLIVCLTSAKASNPPPFTLPDPLRYVVVRPIQNLSAFQTPNQVTTTADQTQAAFSAILDEVTTNAKLSVIQGTDVNSFDPCGKHLELWPAITDFTLDDTTINVQFGFNSTGTIKSDSPKSPPVMHSPSEA
jgi:hypothetical protein